jgi:hypothetical protein
VGSDKLKLEKENQMEKLFTEIKDIIIAGKHTEIEALVEKAAADGANLDDLINNALIANAGFGHDNEKRAGNYKAFAERRSKPIKGQGHSVHRKRRPA